MNMADDASHPDITSMPVGPALSATSDSIPPPEPASEPKPDVTPPKPADEKPPAEQMPPAEGTEGEAGEEGEGEPAPVAAEPPPRRAAATRFSELAAARRLAEE